MPSKATADGPHVKRATPSPDTGTGTAVKPDVFGGVTSGRTANSASISAASAAQHRSVIRFAVSGLHRCRRTDDYSWGFVEVSARDSV